jgi:outer membrane autotransporter protein
VADCHKRGLTVTLRFSYTLFRHFFESLLLFAILIGHAQAQDADLPDVTIIITGEQFGDTEGEGGAADVGEALDELCPTTDSPELQDQCASLASLDDEEAASALREISPDEVPVQASNALEVATIQSNNLRTRVQALRAGEVPTLGLNGLVIRMAGRTLPADAIAGALFEDATGGGASSDESIAGRLGLFVNGFIDFGNKDTTSRELGFDFDTLGITAGADYRVTPKWVLGGAFGYADTDADFDASGGDHESDTWMLSAYGIYYPTEVIYVDWFINYGTSDYTTDRNIPTLGTSTKGDTDGNQWSANINAGADFSKGAWVLTPYGNIEYIDVEIDGYTESGNSGLELAIEDQDIESLRSTLGGRVSRANSFSWGVLNPSAYVEWVHEFEDDAQLLTSRFAADPSVPFTVESDDPDRDFFNLGLSVTGTFPGGRGTFVSYEAVVGQEDVTRHRVNIGFRMEW